jgi:hypothetical protein
MQDTLRGCTRSDDGAGLVGGTAAGGYTVSQPWLRYKQGGSFGPSPGLRPELWCKPLQDPTSYNELMKDQERDNRSPPIVWRFRQPEELPILTGPLMSLQRPVMNV